MPPTRPVDVRLAWWVGTAMVGVVMCAVLARIVQKQHRRVKVPSASNAVLVNTFCQPEWMLMNMTIQTIVPNVKWEPNGKVPLRNAIFVAKGPIKTKPHKLTAMNARSTLFCKTNRLLRHCTTTKTIVWHVKICNLPEQQQLPLARLVLRVN
jgi:hypothetical protein